MKTILLTLSILTAMLTVSSCCQSGTNQCADTAAACDSTKCETKFAATPDEIAAIRIPLDMYVAAAVQGDSKVAQPAFAKGATISHTENDTLICSPISDLFAYYDATGKQEASYEIADISVAGDVAMVRIESKFGQTEFSDMFTLVKDGDDWKIVSKVYHNK